MSKPEVDPSARGTGMDEGTSWIQKDNESPNKDHDFFHLTKLQTEPSGSARYVTRANWKVPVSTWSFLSEREFNCSGNGKFTSADRAHLLGRYLPVNGPWAVDRMDTRAYVSQFSSDGSLFVAGFQGSHIRIYNVEKDWKVQKDILARSLHWTVTDTSLSPDQRFLVYASMSPIVHIVNVESAAAKSYANVTDIHEGLDFSIYEDEELSFGVFSVKFSTDGRELVAGTNDDSIYLYDLEANKLTSRFSAHASDVNTVTFADETGNLVYSGSDDNLCKVWDRRCFITEGKESGVLAGHLEGITFIDSRGDGRYFISNGKDQTTKLWDIRKMSSNASSVRSRISNWDYRWMEYPRCARKIRHPSDQSIATYTGHEVLRTLIRCYFSPAYSTGQRYIYTGSHDNCVYIYDVITGEQVAKLDCHHLTVRDCSWHPYYPMLISSSWDGMIARWEFPANKNVPSLARRSIGSRDEDQLFRAAYL